jgi:hypothetical protein
MKKSLTLVLVLLMSVLSAYARTRTVMAQIDFPFTVADKAFPAGTYIFELQPSGDVFKVMGEGKVLVLANVLTRLGKEMRSAPKGAHLVFDKVGDDCSLSEIWAPGEDGFLLLATKGAHTHKLLVVKN